MKTWKQEAIKCLEESIAPLPQELNELDWKVNLSEKSKRLSEHLSAFANYDGGGFIVFGVDNGKIIGVNNDDCTKIIRTIGNIARQNLSPPIIIDHIIEEYQNKKLIFIKIEQSKNRPVHLRNGSVYDSFIRSAGQTRKMEKSEITSLISKSQGIDFEDGIAETNLSGKDILKKIDFVSYFDLCEKPLPDDNNSILDVLCAEKIIRQNGNYFDITNLGAILLAKDIEIFNNLRRKAIRIILYKDKDRLETIKEWVFKGGYASGFNSLIEMINNLLPTNEVIRSALRKELKMYPKIAIRELVANALIHQDFFITGTGPLIEIFSERIEITNPGKTLIKPLRLLDYPPQSRNEKIAAIMRRFNICEERGSGIDKVVAQAEIFQLPAPDFILSENHFKATLFAHKKLSKMTKIDKIRACYQHCCLKYVSGERMNNASLRERFKINAGNYPIASNIIADTISEKLIKQFDPNSNSRRYASYIPFWV